MIFLKIRKNYSAVPANQSFVGFRSGGEIDTKRYVSGEGMQIAVHYLSVGSDRWVKPMGWMSSGNVNLIS